MTKRIAASLGIAIAFAFGTIQGQQLTSSKPLTFEVASIKPNRSDPSHASFGCANGINSANYGTPPGHCRAVNASLRGIIAEAYDVPIRNLEEYIVGAPSWIQSERFDVDAKAEKDTATASELKQMLRHLLEER